MTEPSPGAASSAPPLPATNSTAPVLRAAALAVAAEGPETRPGWDESSFFPPTQPTALSEYGTQFAETQPMPLDLR